MTDFQHSQTLAEPLLELDKKRAEHMVDCWIAISVTRGFHGVETLKPKLIELLEGLKQ